MTGTRYTIALALAFVLVTVLAGAGLAYSPSLDVVHEYEDHSTQLVDVERPDVVVLVVVAVVAERGRDTVRNPIGCHREDADLGRSLVGTGLVQY